MEEFKNYSDEDQENILATLTIVQTMGWSAKNDDKYQFHIILGAKVRSQNAKIKQLENEFENKRDENMQYMKELKDLNDRHTEEKVVNLEMESELVNKEQEINYLKNLVENRDDVTNKLENVFKNKLMEIDDLRSNNESLARQVGKELILEQKLEIQNKVMNHLKDKLKETEDAAKTGHTNLSEKLMLEIGHLEKENNDKVKQLECVETEFEMLKEKLKTIEVENSELLESFQRVDDHNSLKEELRIASRNVTCNFCGESFEASPDLKIHCKENHKQVSAMNIQKQKVKLLERNFSKNKSGLFERRKG